MRTAAPKLALCVAAVALSGCWSGVVWYGKTPDRSREVAVLQDMRGQRVRVGGDDQKIYPAIGVESIAWSPDGAHLAYAARSPSGWLIVRDGVESRVVEGVGQVLWSPDGKHLAAAVERGGRWMVYRDEFEEPSVETLRARSMRFSEDGEHFGYVGDEARKVVAVIDGVKSAPYDTIGHLVFSPRGSSAFAARRGAESFVVVGGKEHGPYEDIAGLSFSPTGRRLAWIASKEDGWFVIEAGSERGPFDRVSGLVWSPKGDNLAYGVGGRVGEWVVREGKPGRAFEGILPGSLRFDPSGAHIAYAVRALRAWRVVVDEEAGAPYEDLEAPLFVGDSAVTAHLARRGEATFLVVDGHQGPVESNASGLVLSPDGTRFLYTANAGLAVRVVEGRIEGGPCGGGQCRPTVTRVTTHDTVIGGTLVWSDSGQTSGYLAGQRIGHRMFLVTDGVPGAELDLAELMAGVTVNPDLAGALTGDSKALTDWVRAEVTLAEKRDPSKAPKQK
ncbi:MAG: hypothetical protein U0441_07250 [Polyangiaceae bacterium]